MPRFAIVLKTERTRRALKKLESDFPKIGKEAARSIGNNAVTNLRNLAPLWRGKLRSSIKLVDVGKESVGISMAYYGIMLERGIRPHFVAYGTQPLRAWSEEKFPAFPNLVNRIIAQQGVPTPAPRWGRPFIKPAIDQTRRVARSLAISSARRGIRRSLGR